MIAMTCEARSWEGRRHGRRQATAQAGGGLDTELLRKADGYVVDEVQIDILSFYILPLIDNTAHKAITFLHSVLRGVVALWREVISLEGTRVQCELREMNERKGYQGQMVVVQK